MNNDKRSIESISEAIGQDIRRIVKQSAAPRSAFNPGSYEDIRMVKLDDIVNKAEVVQIEIPVDNVEAELSKQVSDFADKIENNPVTPIPVFVDGADFKVEEDKPAEDTVDCATDESINSTPIQVEPEVEKTEENVEEVLVLDEKVTEKTEEKPVKMYKVTQSQKEDVIPKSTARKSKVNKEQE